MEYQGRFLTPPAQSFFRDDYPECTPLFVYRGTDRLEIDGILCVPGETFLRSLEPSHAIVAGPSRRSTES